MEYVYSTVDERGLISIHVNAEQFEQLKKIVMNSNRNRQSAREKSYTKRMDKNMNPPRCLVKDLILQDPHYVGQQNPHIVTPTIHSPPRINPSQTIYSPHMMNAASRINSPTPRINSPPRPTIRPVIHNSPPRPTIRPVIRNSPPRNTLLPTMEHNSVSSSQHRVTAPPTPRSVFNIRQWDEPEYLYRPPRTIRSPGLQTN